MNAVLPVETLVTDHLDLWTTALKRKSTAGRGSSSKVELYGIKKLRELILELAVRGLLVPQDPSDEPASELLKKIAVEKAKLVKAGKIKKVKPLSPIADQEQPYELPNGWEWVRCYQVAESRLGKMLDRAKNSGTAYPYLRNTNVQWQRFDLDDIKEINLEPHELEEYRLRDGDLLICEGGEPGRCAIWRAERAEMYFQKALHRVRAFGGVLPEYIAVCLRVDAQSGRLDQFFTGATIKHFAGQELNRYFFPLPPPAEQHRIVAKVDTLMALCDQLEQQTDASLGAHQTLVETLLSALTSAADHAQFASAWQRIAGHFDTLFTTEESIDQLKQTILQLAVMGKLVPQDPCDESIDKTIASIEALPKPARYTKRSPELIQGLCGLSINNPKTPLPIGWQWIPLVEVARLESGHTPSRNRPDWWDGDVPWLGLVDARIHNNGTITETLQHTNEAGLANSAARLLPTGTVCFSRTASVGYVVKMGRPMATSQDFVNWVPTSVITSDWLKLVMITERPAIDRFSKGAVHQTIYYPAWLSMHIALPPVAEQHRIVAKVDELMALCDQLKSRLNDAQTTQLHLADALVERAIY